jgi:hypothetical protein
MLKNLPSKELELVHKVFGDSAVNNTDFSHEEKISCSIKITGKLTDLGNLMSAKYPNLTSCQIKLIDEL